MVRARRVFTATGAPAIRDGAVAFHNGTITFVGPAAAMSTPAAGVVDFGDATILPGFVDAHAHLSLPADGRSYEDLHAGPDEPLLRAGLANARRHLSCGVTTVRDNGARGQLGFAIRRTAPLRVLACGRPLTPHGGHFHFCGGEADTPTELDAAVRTLVAEGADHIKLIASGGGTAGSAPHESTYDRDQLRLAVQTAHALGRLTTAHCRSTESLRRAVAAGVDCVEHVDFLGPDASVAYEPAVAEQLGSAGTYLSMTMQAGGYDALVDSAAGIDTGRGTADLDRIRAYFDDKLATLARLLADGFAERIVLSTDAGPSDTRFGRFGLGLALAVEAGMTPVQALTAATRTAAAACGIADRVGTLRPGQAADLLVTEGDPTVSIGDATRVRAVFVGGVRTR